MARSIPFTPVLALALLVPVLASGCTDPVEAAKGSSIVGETRTMRVQLEMKSLAQEMDRYRAVHGDWPNDLSALRRPYRDPWGGEYAFELDGDRVWITSAGPDGQWDTDDDLGGGR